MQQYFAKNKDLELEDNDYHHIKNVMRMKKGDLIKIVYNNTVNICKLTDVKKEVKYGVISKKVKQDDEHVIDVAFSLIKEQKLNYLLQKTTEVGVSTLIPINTKRCVVKLDKKKEESKLIRWKKILKEASEQSSRVNVPDLLEVKNINELAKLDYDLKILCSLNKNSKNIKKVLEKNNKCAKILLVIGPEGGFEDEEENHLIDNGFIPVSLGETILRAETAPVVALSMIKYEFMRWVVWKTCLRLRLILLIIFITT